jgi:surfactin synthase thioesterase subunit
MSRASRRSPWQPPALMLWGRHDPFFDLAETVAWMQALPRMEAHVLDGPHCLLETHASDCVALMRTFFARTERARGGGAPVSA